VSANCVAATLGRRLFHGTVVENEAATPDRCPRWPAHPHAPDRDRLFAERSWQDLWHLVPANSAPSGHPANTVSLIPRRPASDLGRANTRDELIELDVKFVGLLR